jgi:hypothetical protein
MLPVLHMMVQHLLLLLCVNLINMVTLLLLLLLSCSAPCVAAFPTAASCRRVMVTAVITIIFSVNLASKPPTRQTTAR